MHTRSSPSIEAAQQGRINKVLDTRVRIDGAVITWRTWLSDQRKLERHTTDGMIHWSRARANRLTADACDAYEARLRSQVLYWVNNVQVPKIVYDVAVAL